jgi:hypothetical protein
MAIKKEIELEVKVDSVGTLKQQLKQAQREVETLAAKFGATSEAATNAAKKAAALKDEIGDAKALTDAFNPDAKFNAFGSALQGVAGGFSAVQGAMGLIGVESSAVEATLLKVQSAMALSEGINSVMGAKDAFTNLAAVIGKTALGQKLLTAAQVAGAATMRVLNVVMAANPVLLIVAGITALVGALAYFTSSSESAAEANDKLNESFERQKEAIDASNSRLIKSGETKLAILEAQGADEKKIHNQTVQNIKNEEKVRQNNIKYIEELHNQKKLILKRAYEDEDSELIKATRAEIYQTKAKYDELYSLKQDLNDKIRIENIRFATQQKQEQAEADKKEKEEANRIAKERRDKRVAAAKEAKAEQLRIEKEYNDAVKKAQQELEDEINKIYEAAEAKRAKEQADRKEAAAKAEQDIYDNAKGYLEAAAINYEDNLQVKKNLLEIEKEILLQNKELTEGEIAAIDAKYRKDREQLDADELEKARANQRQKVEMAVQAIGVLQDAMSLFTAKNETDARRQFKINKALSLSSAVVNTALAVTAALTAGGNPIKLATGMQFVEAGIAAASGAVSIAKIAGTQFGGGGSGSGGGGGNNPSSPNNNMTQGVITPNFNIVGNNGQNQLGQLGSPIQAYVVSSDMTSQQQLDRNRLRNATF